MNGSEPLEKGDPLNRDFPLSWKNTFFRRNAIIGPSGNLQFVCPLCQKAFTHKDIDSMHGDHIWPWSLFGDSSWQNYRLLCGECNMSRGNRLNVVIRKCLGSGEFRKILQEFILEEP